VPGDQVASIVRADAAPTTIFLPGLCSNAYAYLLGFPEAARKAGGVVAIDGDQPCEGAPGFHSFSWDARKQHARIEAALAAAGLESIPASGLTIIGYSQGASIAEQLAASHPERYTRVVLIGQPGDPSPKALARSRAVVTMSCSLDVPFRMKPAAHAIEQIGVPATYVQMPGCTHGNIADGEVAFTTAFDFLNVHARDPVAENATPITGVVPD
jgi:pimeloyl-ACP methyl ester carboxylesterase